MEESHPGVEKLKRLETVVSFSGGNRYQQFKRPCWGNLGGIAMGLPLVPWMRGFSVLRRKFEKR